MSFRNQDANKKMWEVFLKPENKINKKFSRISMNIV